MEEDSVLCSLLDPDDELPVLELLEEEEDELLELDGLLAPRLGDSGFFSTGVTLSVFSLSSSACAWFSRSCALLRIFFSLPLEMWGPLDVASWVLHRRALSPMHSCHLPPFDRGFSEASVCGRQGRRAS